MEPHKRLFHMFLRNLKFTYISEMRIENRSMIKRNTLALTKKTAIKKKGGSRALHVLRNQCLAFVAKMFAEEDSPVDMTWIEECLSPSPLGTKRGNKRMESLSPEHSNRNP